MQETRQIIRFMCIRQDHSRELCAEDKADNEGYVEKTRQITKICTEEKADIEGHVQKTRQVTSVMCRGKGRYRGLRAARHITRVMFGGLGR